MIGASDLKANAWTATYTANRGATTGSQTLTANSQPNYFAYYEKNKWVVAYEYSRNWGNTLTMLPGMAVSSLRNDDRGWYAMVSYKVTPRLTPGFYESQNSDRQAPLGVSRYQKDFAFPADMT